MESRLTDRSLKNQNPSIRLAAEGLGVVGSIGCAAQRALTGAASALQLTDLPTLIRPRLPSLSSVKPAPPHPSFYHLQL